MLFLDPFFHKSDVYYYFLPEPLIIDNNEGFKSSFEWTSCYNYEIYAKYKNFCNIVKYSALYKLYEDLHESQTKIIDKFNNDFNVYVLLFNFGLYIKSIYNNEESDVYMEQLRNQTNQTKTITELIIANEVIIRFQIIPLPDYDSMDEFGIIERNYVQYRKNPKISEDSDVSISSSLSDSVERDITNEINDNCYSINYAVYIARMFSIHNSSTFVNINADITSLYKFQMKSKFLNIYPWKHFDMDKHIFVFAIPSLYSDIYTSVEFSFIHNNARTYKNASLKCNYISYRWNNKLLYTDMWWGEDKIYNNILCLTDEETKDNYIRIPEKIYIPKELRYFFDGFLIFEVSDNRSVFVIENANACFQFSKKIELVKMFPSKSLDWLITKNPDDLSDESGISTISTESTGNIGNIEESIKNLKQIYHLQ